MNANENDESKDKNNPKHQADKLLIKEVRKPPGDMKYQTPPVSKENVKAELNEEGKKRHGKGRLHHQSGLKGESELVLPLNPSDMSGSDKKNQLKYATDKNQRVLGSEKMVGNVNRKNIQRLVAAAPAKIDKNDNSYQNKFGGSTCPPLSTRPPRKFPPLHLPSETTCTKKCTTCPILIQFTIPNVDFLTFRPPCPEIDQMVIPEFTISIIPIACDKENENSSPTDLFFEIFHESGSWPHGLEGNKTLIKGQRALFYLSEIRENVTRQPFVFHAENNS